MNTDFLLFSSIVALFAGLLAFTLIFDERLRSHRERKIALRFGLAAAVFVFLGFLALSMVIDFIWTAILMIQ